jgi:hypothetical protein
MAAAYSGRQNHSYSSNVANTKQAQVRTRSHTLR